MRDLSIHHHRNVWADFVSVTQAFLHAGELCFEILNCLTDGRAGYNDQTFSSRKVTEGRWNENGGQEIGYVTLSRQAKGLYSFCRDASLSPSMTVANLLWTEKF